MPQVTYNHKALIERRRELRKSMTPPEVVLWSHLKGKGLGVKFRRQHSIGKYIVDFFCADIRLVVEVDGDQHGEPGQRSYDRVRDKYLEQCGLRVLRIPARAVIVNQYGVLDTIRCMVRHSR